MTNEYELADDSRESLIWTKEQLVVPLQPGMEAPPHPMRLGETEEDYYNGSAAIAAAAEPERTGRPESGGRSSGPDAGPPASRSAAVSTASLALSGATSPARPSFWILAVVSVGRARHGPGAAAVHCAVLLAVVMLSLAVLYALQGAPFLAFVQVIVYTGAVLMLFLFVLMIVGISVGGLGRRDDQGPAAGRRRWPASGCSSCSPWSSGTRPSARPPGAGGLRRGQHDRPRPADLHHVRVPVRGHQRPADHGRARRHGAGPPGAHHAQADPARAVPAPDRQRAPRAAARPRHLRPAQRGGHAGPAAGRHAVRAVGEPGDRRGAARAADQRRHAAGQRRRRYAAGLRRRREPGGGGRDEPGPLRGPGRDLVRDRRASASWSAATRWSCSCASS